MKSIIKSFIWVAIFSSGLASSFALCAEQSDREYIDSLYRQYLGQPAEEGGIFYYTGELKKPNGRAQVQQQISSSPEAQAYAARVALAAQREREETGFINGLYEEYLGYTANESGLKKYRGILAEMGEAGRKYVRNRIANDVQAVKRRALRALSEEVIQGHRNTIRDLYLQYVGFEPNEGGYKRYLPMILEGGGREQAEAIISASSEAKKYAEKLERDRQMRELLAANSAARKANCEACLSAASPLEKMQCLVQIVKEQQAQIAATPGDAVTRNLGDELAPEISEWEKSLKRQMTIDYLERFYADIRNNPTREKDFFLFLKVLHKLFPDAPIYDYFFNFGNHEANAPQLAGLQVLVDHMAQKGKYAGLEKIVEMTTLKDLTGALRRLNDQDFIGERKLLVLHAGSVGGHYSPLFIRRSTQDTIIVMPESGPFMRRASGDDPTMVINAFHQAIFNQVSAASLPNLKIFTFNQARQADGVSCSITSLGDVLEGHQFNLIDYVLGLDEAAVTQWEDTVLYRIEYPPPPFMKSRQSTSYLPAYEQAYPQWAGAIVSQKMTGVGEMKTKTLQDIITQSTISEGGRDVNFYTRGKAFKYFKILVEKALEKAV